MAQHLRKRLLDGSHVLDLVVAPTATPPARIAAPGRRRAGGARATRPRRDLRRPRARASRRAGVGHHPARLRQVLHLLRGALHRGRERSLPLVEILRQVEHAVAAATASGVPRPDRQQLPPRRARLRRLLRAADRVPGLERIRYTSPHPADMGERVIAAMAECAKVMPQVHLRSSRLGRRARAHGAHLHARPVRAWWRGCAPPSPAGAQHRPHRRLPGETEEDFRRTVEYMQEARWDSAFLFKYSARPTQGLALGRRRARGGEGPPAAGADRPPAPHLRGDQRRLVAARSRCWSRAPPPRRRPAVRAHAQFKAVVLPNDGTSPGTLSACAWWARRR